MKIERIGLSPIIKSEIDLSNLDNFSQEKVDAVTPLLKETIEKNPISTFGLITLMRKNFEKDLLTTFQKANFDYSSLNYNCFFFATLLKERLSKESIKGYLMTYQANKYALDSGDAKVKEAHISVIYPTIKDGRIFYTIFDPGLKIDKPLSFYKGSNSNGFAVNRNQISICYDPNNIDYPYYMDMVGINEYSYNKSDHRIFQRFNPKYETINIEQMLFPISHRLLTGYKAIIYSTDISKRAYITLSHLEQNLVFSDCITGIEHKYTYDELEKIGYQKLKRMITSTCYKLQLDPDDIVSNIYFMIYYHNDYIDYIMDQGLLKEYSDKNNIKRLTR